MEWVKSQREAGKDPLGALSDDSEEEVEAAGTADDQEKTSPRPNGPEKTDPAPAAREQDKPKASALANFHRMQRDFEAQRQAFAAEKRELESYKSVLENAKVDRIAALEAMGYKDVKSFLEGLAEDGGRMTPERRELLELKQWREKQEKAAEEAQQHQRTQMEQQHINQQLDAIRREVQTKLKSDVYGSRIVNISGADEQVMQQMDKMAAETGEMPRIEDAIEAIESRYRENLKVLADNPEVRKYFQDLFKSPSQAPSPSKSKGKLSTIGSEVRSPGVARTEEYVPSADGEREIQEALAFLDKKKRARR